MDGKHANMCFTDPPYNINYEGGMNETGQNYRQGIMNDSMGKKEFQDFLRAAVQNIIEFTDGGIYICMSSKEIETLKKVFEESLGHFQSFIIWVKNHFTLSRSDYQNMYEPMLYGWREGISNHYFINRRDIGNVWEDLKEIKTEFDGEYTTISFQGFKVKLKGQQEGEVIRKKQVTDIWRYDKPTRSDLHPTMKPIALVTEAITNSSMAEQIVLDTFLGSGSTLISAEKAGRICYGMEMDPKYASVILQRYAEFTGLDPVREDGVKWSELKAQTNA
jgi:DNA modification methylase